MRQQVATRIRNNFTLGAISELLMYLLGAYRRPQARIQKLLHPFAELFRRPFSRTRHIRLQRLASRIASGAALMALGLSAVGVSGVMAYSVVQRVHEIGVRMALGANPADVLRLFVKHGLKLLLLGVCIGLPLAFALARLLSSLLFGVQSNDFFSFFRGALLLAVVVFVACYIPARQATCVDPMVALRYE